MAENETPGPMIPTEILREQVGKLSDETSDELLAIYLRAAVRVIERRTGRVIYAGSALPQGAPENALLLEGDVQLAIMLLIGHWDANRDESSIPAGLYLIIDPLRWFSL